MLAAFLHATIYKQRKSRFSTKLVTGILIFSQNIPMFYAIIQETLFMSILYIITPLKSMTLNITKNVISFTSKSYFFYLSIHMETPINIASIKTKGNIFIYSK